MTRDGARVIPESPADRGAEREVGIAQGDLQVAVQRRIRRGRDGFPNELRAGDAVARVVPTPFYDREGTRVRG